MFIGKQQTVLVEKVTKNGLAKGYGEHYVPVEFKPANPGPIISKPLPSKTFLHLHMILF